VLCKTFVVGATSLNNAQVNKHANKRNVSAARRDTADQQQAVAATGVPRLTESVLNCCYLALSALLSARADNWAVQCDLPALRRRVIFGDFFRVEMASYAVENTIYCAVLLLIALKYLFRKLT
jgi:hypothetical protein